MEESKEIPMYRDEKKEYQLEQILNKIEEADGIVKTSDILALGIDYRRVQTFVKEGELRKIRNGSYTSGRKSYPEEDLITALFPDGVLTLQSALFAYGYLDEMPEIWQIAISKNTSKSRFNILYPSVEPSYTEDDVLLIGQEKIQYQHNHYEENCVQENLPQLRRSKNSAKIFHSQIFHIGTYHIPGK